MFKDEKARARAEAILARYGTEPHEQEAPRVRLAILKLAGTDLARLARDTEKAKEDFRDYIVWAESPNLGRISALPEGPEKEKLRQQDRDQWESWLAG